MCCSGRHPATQDPYLSPEFLLVEGAAWQVPLQEGLIGNTETVDREEAAFLSHLPVESRSNWLPRVGSCKVRRVGEGSRGLSGGQGAAATGSIYMHTGSAPQSGQGGV